MHVTDQAPAQGVDSDNAPYLSMVEREKKSLQAKAEKNTAKDVKEHYAKDFRDIKKLNKKWRTGNRGVNRNVESAFAEEMQKNYNAYLVHHGWLSLYEDVYFFLRPNYFFQREHETAKQSCNRVSRLKKGLGLAVTDECDDPEVVLLKDMVDFLEKNVNLGAVPPQTGAMK